MISAGSTCLMIVVDGMGGHADGARAAAVTVEAVGEAFRRRKQPMLDPQGFLHHALARAHAAVVALGDGRAMESRPRATCALCLVQDRIGYWAHVGDSRIYHLRAGTVQARTRDHSHVELLLRDGVITEAELAAHPMRNYVECCLGGDAWLPGMSVAARPLAAGDVLLACTDGLWTGLDDDRIASLSMGNEALAAGLRRLGEQAVRASAPGSDNTSATALRVA